MLQFPAFMTQYPTRTIPASNLLPSQSVEPQNEEILLAMEEAEYEEKLNDIRKTKSNVAVIGKTTAENEKEEYDNDVDEDDGDNAEESDGEEFEQETA